MNLAIGESRLRQWIVDQTREGREPQDVVAIMMADGWSRDYAFATVEMTLRGNLADRSSLSLSVNPSRSANDAAHALRPMRVMDRDVEVLMRLRDPQLLVLGGLLSADECDELIGLARDRLRPSETLDEDSGHLILNPARTSRGMFFSRGENELCRRIEARMAALMQCPLENGEGLQIHCYGPGDEYAPHHDWFDPARAGSVEALQRGGQRVASLICYLNTPTEGGATAFPELQLDVGAVKGNAVLFSYGLPHQKAKTLHAGSPVLRGVKWVATKWVRERSFE